MADKIGVARKWLQKPGTHHEHFDVAMSKRKLAVSAGAKEIGRRELYLLIQSKRLDARAKADPTMPLR